MTVINELFQAFYNNQLIKYHDLMDHELVAQHGYRMRNDEAVFRGEGHSLKHRKSWDKIMR